MATNGEERFAERALARPSLAAVAALVVGMATARAAGGESPWGAVAVAAIAGAVGFLPAWRLAAMLLAFAAAGAAMQAPLNDAEARSRAVVAEIERVPGGLAQATGRIAGEVRVAEREARFLVDDATVARAGEAVRLPAAIMVRVPFEDAAEWRNAVDGDGVELAGRLFATSDDPAAGSFEHWLATQGAVAEMRATVAAIDRIDRGPVAHMRLAMQRAADAIERVFVANLSTEGAAVLDAMVLGRTHLLSPEQRDAYRRTGLIHIFSVSGLHAGIAAMAIAAIATAAGAGPRWRSIATLLGLFAFCGLTGFHTPAIRAALLATVFLVQPLVRREVDALGALATVALAVLAFRPAAVWQLDFQLSFLCAATLALVAPGMVAIEEWAGRSWMRGKWSLHFLVRAAQCLLATTALQLALAPLLALHFGSVSLVAPLANMVALPLVPVAMGAGFAGAALAPAMPPVAELLFGAVDAIVAVLDRASALAASPSWASISADPWPPWTIGAWYAALLAGRWVRLRPRFTPFDGAFSATLGIAGAALVALVLPRGATTDRLTVEFLDVGQGDAILVRARDGATMLVDTGPPQGVGLMEHLRARSVRRLDVLVLTHADADHIGGADRLLENMPVDLALTGGSLADTDTWREVAREVAWRDVETATLRRGASFDLSEDVRVDVLHPTAEFVEAGDDRNDGSVVLRVAMGDVSFLLTGDAEAEAEAAMLLGAEEALLDCDVLKAGHHGSGGSTTAVFLAATSPVEAVMSCGRGNRYGHPAATTLQRCEAGGARVRRTDEHGTVRYDTDGRRLRVSVERE